MAKDFTVTINHPLRQIEWLEVFGTTRLHVKSCIPVLDILPGEDEPQPVYYVDLDCLDAHQQKRLIHYLSDRFKVPAAEIQKYLAEEDLPIPAEGCILTVFNPHLWLCPVS